MKKREVYEGYRFPCEKEMFSWGNDKEDNELLWNYLSTLCRFKKYMYTCPCGKGCKPIRCRIIVENEVRGRRLDED